MLHVEGVYHCKTPRSSAASCRARKQSATDGSAAHPISFSSVWKDQYATLHLPAAKQKWVTKGYLVQQIGRRCSLWILWIWNIQKKHRKEKMKCTANVTLDCEGRPGFELTDQKHFFHCPSSCFSCVIISPGLERVDSYDSYQSVAMKHQVCFTGTHPKPSSQVAANDLIWTDLTARNCVVSGCLWWWCHEKWKSILSVPNGKNMTS